MKRHCNENFWRKRFEETWRLLMRLSNIHCCPVHHQCQLPSLVLVGSATVDGVTFRGIHMDITIHKGKQQVFRLEPETAGGQDVDFHRGQFSETTSDENVSKCVSDPDDASLIAVTGEGLGSATVTATYTNPDGNAASLVINVTVIEEDATQLVANAVGGEGNIGDPFGS